MTLKSPDKYKQLVHDGFCIFEHVLDDDILCRLKDITERLITGQSQDHFEAQRSTGTMISVFDDPAFAELVTYPGAIEVLADLSFTDPKWRSGYIISKPPGTPALFWHQDWWGWNDPSSYTPLIQQIFLMYYLVDTTIENGCLRVLPGSHQNRHPMHDTAPEAHTDELRRVSNPDHIAYQDTHDALDIMVKAGDLVIGDARLLHGAHANDSDKNRTVITLWYHPVFDDLPEPLKASTMARQHTIDHWPQNARDLIAPLLPEYTGSAEATVWNRVPDEQLLGVTG